MGINYASQYSTKVTPQSEPIPGSNQVKNSAGGYSFQIDKWGQLLRFLILGTEGGSYYVSERNLTKQNANSVLECIKEDGVRTVNTIVEVSYGGRAPKNDPAIFALAMCLKMGNNDTKRAASAAVSKVCRIGTHIFQFAEAVEAFGGWGRTTRNAIANWYQTAEPNRLAMQTVKYQQRNGWSHRDLLRLSHPVPDTAVQQSLYRYATAGINGMGSRTIKRRGPKDSVIDQNQHADANVLPRIIHAFEQAKGAKSRNEIIPLIREYNLPRECIPTQFLTDPHVWEALLEKMPIHAMVRNLGNMSKCGLLAPMSEAAKLVMLRLRNKEHIQKSRLHPISLLSSLFTYGAGHSVRGHGTWQVVGQVKDALDDAFYLSFGNVQSTGKNWMLALDVSGSMTWADIAGVPGLTPRVASAAMAMVTAASEPNHVITAFANSIQTIPITPRDRLDTACKVIDRLPASSTDCSLPMIYALNNNIPVDVFVVLTDSETWSGSMHPPQALRQYRERTGRNAKMAVVGMLSNGFTIADPNDAGMLDVVGFDTATPQMLSNFATDWQGAGTDEVED